MPVEFMLSFTLEALIVGMIAMLGTTFFTAQQRLGVHPAFRSIRSRSGSRHPVRAPLISRTNLRLQRLEDEKSRQRDAGVW